jgi:UDP-3-O-[3-hydroxymyristoyl] N-acetylglucosamine deacetylase
MSITLAGTGLFTGVHCTLTLERHDGPLTVQALGEVATLADFRPGRSPLSSTLALPGGRELRTVEHLFAAVAGFRAYHGLRLTVEGPEVPLLDGTASLFAEALARLDVPASAPATRIVRPFAVQVSGSDYRFEPQVAVCIESTLVTDDPRLVGTAIFGGDAHDFRARIAPARTFAFARDLEAYAALGIATHLEPEHFVILGDTILAAGAPFQPDEPARHKLLDLLGDLVLHGGVPRGRITVRRPGHARTHEALAHALAAGAIGSSGPRGGTS